LPVESLSAKNSLHKKSTTFLYYYCSHMDIQTAMNHMQHKLQTTDTFKPQYRSAFAYIHACTCTQWYKRHKDI